MGEKEVKAMARVAAEKDELFCAYAAMILQDSDAEITEENLNKLIKAAGGSTSSFFPSLFAKMCKGKDVGEFLKLGGGGGGGPAAAAAPAAADTGAGKKEEKVVVEE